VPKSKVPPTDSSVNLYVLPTRHRQHVIEEIMPRREVHILAAASGAGKTTLMVQLIDDLATGREVFGAQTHSVHIGYLCNDRSQDDLTRTFERVSPKTEIPHYSLLTHPEFQACNTVFAAIALLKAKHPEVDFVVFDPISTQIDNINHAKEVGNFLKALTQLAQKLDITILIIHHTSKTKSDSTYSSPRQMMAGCGAWGGYSNLNLILQEEDNSDPTNPFRILYICPRNGQNKTLRFMVDERGCFMPVPFQGEKANPKEKKAHEDGWFNAQPLGLLTAPDIYDGLGHPTDGSMYRIVRRWIATEMLERTEDKGTYRKRGNIPATSPEVPPK
jgi:AAA domain